MEVWKQLRQTRTVNTLTSVRWSCVGTDILVRDEVRKLCAANWNAGEELPQGNEGICGCSHTKCIVFRSGFHRTAENDIMTLSGCLPKVQDELRVLHVTVFSDEARFRFIGYVNICRIVPYGRRKIPAQSMELPCQNWCVGVLFVPFLLHNTPLTRSASETHTMNSTDA
jgi:hypothetical protein